jgi:flagellar biosynthesis chaperone FliJ
VENLATATYGDRHIQERQATAELARVNRELKQLRVQLAALEERRSELVSELAR